MSDFFPSSIDWDDGYLGEVLGCNGPQRARNYLQPAVLITKAETELRRAEGWDLHTDWAFHDPSFGGTFREDCRETVCSECGKVW